jgi:hypothetical protein
MAVKTKLKHQTSTVKISDLVYNRGQFDGLPSNPRFIRGDSYELMRASIRETPSLLELRPPILFPMPGAGLLVIAGEMRSRAAHDEGHKNIPAIILHDGTPVALLREIAIKDNTHFGEWDMDDLASSWGDGLGQWGAPTSWGGSDEAPGDRGPAKKDPFDDQGVTGSNAYGVIIMCETEAVQEVVFKKMQGDGYTCKIVVV